MEEGHSNLPDDVDALRAIIAAQAGQLAEQARKLQSRDTLIGKLKAQLAVLKRSRFGSSSEKMDRAIEQLELALEEIEATEAEDMILASPSIAGAAKAKPSRQPLPDHLPRHDVTHQATCTCPVCGGSDFIRAGESVSEILDYVPASFRVMRHIQPSFTCKGCDTQVKAEMPSLPIERGKPGPGLVAHVLIAKYCRSSASLSPIRDLRAGRRQPFPFAHGRLDRQGQHIAGAAAGDDQGACVRWPSTSW